MVAWSAQKAEKVEKDFWLFLDCVRINSKDKGGRYKISEGVYEAQRRFVRGVFQGLQDDIHDFKILKSRQLGLSTIVRAMSVFWLGIHEGLHGAVVFDTNPHTEGARREITSMIKNLPKSLKFPDVQADSRYGLVLENESQIEFMQAGVRETKSSGSLGRSTGLNFLHCSEMCEWANIVGLLSLKQAISDTFENRLYFWESTARGFNSWYEMWVEAKADELNQKTMFFGWWSKETQRIPKGTREFEKYGSESPTTEERRKIELVKELYDFEIDQEQLAWYRRKSDPTQEMEEDESVDGHLQAEQPWTEDEAFIQSGSTFFSAETLTEITKNAMREKPKARRFWPGQDFFNCQITSARTYRDTHIKEFEEPEADACYIIGADPAYGYDESNDRASAQVLKCYADGVEQVCEAASAEWSPEHFAWVILTLMGYYGDHGRNEVNLAVELQGGGEAVWLAIKSARLLIQDGYLRDTAREKGMENLFTNMRNYLWKRADAFGDSHSFHIKTSLQTKVAMMERLRDFTHNGTLLIRSVDTLNEMKTIAREGDNIEAAGSNKDDRAVSLAIGIRAWEDRVRPRLVSQRRTKAAAEARKAGDPRSRFQIFSEYQMENFFHQRNKTRKKAQQVARRDGWRYSYPRDKWRYTR